MTSQPLDAEQYDALLVLTPHRSLPLKELAGRARLLFDTRNALGRPMSPNVVRL